MHHWQIKSVSKSKLSNAKIKKKKRGLILCIREIPNEKSSFFDWVLMSLSVYHHLHSIKTNLILRSETDKRVKTLNWRHNQTKAFIYISSRIWLHSTLLEPNLLKIMSFNKSAIQISVLSDNHQAFFFPSKTNVGCQIEKNVHLIGTFELKITSIQ